MGLIFLEGLILRGAYIRWENLRYKIDWVALQLEGK